MAKETSWFLVALRCLVVQGYSTGNAENQDLQFFSNGVTVGCHHDNLGFQCQNLFPFCFCVWHHSKVHLPYFAHAQHNLSILLSHTAKYCSNGRVLQSIIQLLSVLLIKVIESHGYRNYFQQGSFGFVVSLKLINKMYHIWTRDNQAHITNMLNNCINSFFLFCYVTRSWISTNIEIPVCW